MEPENYWPHWVLGRTLMGRGDGSGAELAFNAAIALQPGYARGYEQRALAVGQQWRASHDEPLRRRAQGDSERAMREAAGDPSVFWPRGELFELFGQTRDALDAYSRWLELEDNILSKISVVPRRPPVRSSPATCSAKRQRRTRPGERSVPMRRDCWRWCI